MIQATIAHLKAREQSAAPEFKQFFSDRIEQLQAWVSMGRTEADETVRDACEEWLKL